MSLAQNEARLLRFPATNGEIIAFTYAGDIYTVAINGGIARKLTSHAGFEMFPHFSPDGKTIAFTGQYDGNTEVFTMPTTGGVPQRLSYTATLDRDDVSDRMGPNNIVMAWTPDGENIVYRSRKQTFGFRGHLFSVAKNGGLSEQIPLPEGGFCSYSADGKKLAYNRVFREFRTWKYYEGGMADDIWIHDFTTRKTINITNNKAQDIIPMWINDEIFFISDRDRTMNLFVYNTKTQQTEKVTDFKEFDIKFPTNNKDYIVFENGGYIYKFDIKTRKAEKVTIRIAEDFNDSRKELSKDISKNITAASMSPNAERIVISARGEIFDVPVINGATRNITNSSGAHERMGSWSPDGRWIAYISDATGETELYIAVQDGLAEPIQLTKNNDTYISYFVWSPDSKKILYTDRKNRLQYVDIASKQVSHVLQGKRGGAGGLAWSPDSKWFAYSLSEANDMSVIYLYNIQDKKQYPVTDKWYSSYAPNFSSDGKYLYFTSARNFSPTYSNIEWDFAYNNMNKLYMAVLAKDTPSPFEIKNDEVKVGSEEKEAKDGKPDDRKAQDKPAKDTKIDTDGLLDRIIALPIAPGFYRQVAGIGNKVYYARNGVKVFDLTTQKETDIADGGMFSISPNNKKMLLASGGGRGRSANYYVIDLPLSKANLNKPLDFSGLKADVDYRQEWNQIFDESWRHMRDGFYVENMHGVDWKAMKKKYAVLLPYVNHRADLTYIIGELIGELNVGHAYVNSGEMPKPQRLKIGLLGAKISLDKSGYFRIDEILEGTNWDKDLRSPLTEIGVNTKNGEYIIAIDGISTQTVKDLYQLLVDKADKKVEITLNSKPEPAGSRKAIIVPLATESQLYYYNWVQNNIRKVEKATNGRVGYVHVPDMGVPGLNEFAKYFYPQLDKEALIIDDRTNGGGNVSPMILERLARIPYRATAWRSSSYPGVIPNKTLVGPKTVIIDKYSMSDGDLFPYGFRELGLGKLIGKRTWGGIVGISGSLPFIDGADLRVPMFTSYSMETGQWIIEGYGVDPDIEVDNDPAKEWDGEDEQLNKAIEQMLLELKDRKPVPPVPTGPDRSKKK
ncbi:MAG: PDZ domain-containing protein [Prevotellaceae bacterium]|nr:PDZ domain-containing protein [Prevotellaceae bacterium]